MKKLWGAAAALLAVATLVGTALVFTGSLAMVTTSGISMAPRIHAGDLVLVQAASSYEVGDSAAYHSDMLDTTVLHRIVKIRNGRYTFQGDNNSWLDPERPTQDKLIGKELLHIPQGEVWLERITSPVALGLLAFGLLAVGGNAARTRRQRQRRRTVSQHTARPTGRSLLTGLPSWATTTAASAALVGALGIALGFASWTTSATPIRPGAQTGAAAPGQQMTFDYTATVPQSPAYDDTTVSAPEPVFRKLTDTVDVAYSYNGYPGRIAVAAVLSTTNGWTSTLPLRAAEPFSGSTYTGTVTLDLDALEKRAQAAAVATGISAGDVTVKVVPTVITAQGKFKPGLPLNLSALQLTLAGDKSALKVDKAADAGPATEAGPATPTAPVLSLVGREIPVTTARVSSLVMGGAAALAALLVGLVLWRTAPATHAAAIRRRYANLLMEVEPIVHPQGRPVVDVVDFATLAKLAERYELLVLHWSRSDVETFVVQDQGTTYRYRTDSSEGSSESENDDLAVASDIDHEVRNQP